ncbi:MAG TPA: amidase family protein, partial [Pseudonocardiaceae bacterium]|nr:amidase family protein [Pseudonocardiaceae bacterium]
LLEQGRTERATEYSSAQRCRAQLRATVDDDLSGLDALLTPTIATVAKRWDAPDLDDWSIARFLPAFNLTGHPAISLPVPSERLPVGIQVVGHRGQDHALLATARWIEQHSP